MPRVENTGMNVDCWYQSDSLDAGNGSSTHDVCRNCAARLEADPLCFSGVVVPLVLHSLDPYNGDPQGDTGWQAGADHPPYDEMGDYTCEVCNAPLTGRDD